jgi:hypothetical protein
MFVHNVKATGEITLLPMFAVLLDPEWKEWNRIRPQKNVKIRGMGVSHGRTPKLEEVCYVGC